MDFDISEMQNVTVLVEFDAECRACGGRGRRPTFSRVEGNVVGTNACPECDGAGRFYGQSKHISLTELKELLRGEGE